MTKDCEIKQGARIRPDIKEPSKSMFSPGISVEVSYMIDKVETVWVPAMIIRDFVEEGDKKKFFVKEGNKCHNTIVDLSRIRPTPPASSVKDFQLLDCVEVFGGWSWRQGSVRAILTAHRYKVSFGAKKEESIFNESELRQFMEWEDGVWFKRSLKEYSDRKRKTEASAEENKDNEIDLPFVKKLTTSWKRIESMEVFKTIPQSPHFSPLVKIKESTRESSAIGMMFTYSVLLEEVKGLHLSSPISTLGSLNDSFAELENHGFDVKEPRSRIHKLLSLKDRQAKKSEEVKEIAEKILELQRKKEEADKELQDVELQFQTIVSTPW